MNKTSIEWTHRPETGGAQGGFTWNPIRARLKVCPSCGHRHDLTARCCWQLAEGGFQRCLCDLKQTGTFCTRISPGCKLCYASAINIRFGNGLEYVVTNLSNIEFFIDEKILEEPLKRKKPATIFVGDMFDLFHEAIPDAEISYVFATMYDAKQHTFQLLTKRPDRMMRFILHWGVAEENIWLGTSIESPDYKERADFLRNTPAELHYLSIEPLLSDIGRLDLSGIEWVICGGESGPGARPFNLAWAESLQEQCKAAGVPFFMKQIGSKPLIPKAMELSARGEFLTETTCGDPARLIVTSKGGDMSEWPESLRVREFPAERSVSERGAHHRADAQ